MAIPPCNSWVEIEVQVPYLASIDTQGGKAPHYWWAEVSIPAPYVVSTDTPVEGTSLLLVDGESPDYSVLDLLL